MLLYDAVLERPLARFKDLTRARLCSRLPVVLTAGEEHRVLGALRGEQRLDETLLYGSGLRFIECLRLRVKDDDFERRELRPSPSRECRATGSQGGGTAGGDRQASYLPHVSTRVCVTFVGGELRYTDGTGAIGAS